jgi:hypothetical protein
MSKSTTKEFIEKAKLLHGTLYNYDKTVYIRSTEKVIILCKTHGEFEQLPSSHLRPRGCPYCSAVFHGLNTTEVFIWKAQLVHKDKYAYSKVAYIGSKIKVPITCPIHGEFLQKPCAHVSGSGCPACAEYGFDPSKPAYLYYLKITTDDNSVLYKIGITNRTVDERFNLTELSKIEIVKQKLYENGQEALDWEQKLLKMYKQYRYIGPAILHNGNTELFTKDIIALYYEENNL